MKLEGGEPDCPLFCKIPQPRMTSKHWRPIKDTSWWASELPAKSLVATPPHLPATRADTTITSCALMQIQQRALWGVGQQDDLV